MAEHAASGHDAEAVSALKFTKAALAVFGTGDVDAPEIRCAKCGRSERMSGFHFRLFSQWQRRPEGVGYLPAVRIAESNASPIAGNGLFAAQSIPKNTVVTYYPAHAVTNNNGGVDHSLFVELSCIPPKEMTHEAEFEIKLTQRSLTHLVNGCGFNVMSWPSCTRRSDELGDCANDNINFVALLPLFSAFFKAPSAATYKAFSDAVDAYRPSTNCAFVTNCASMTSDGSMYMRAAQHGPGRTDYTAVPVPSLIALRDIEKGEELTVSYGARYWLCDMYIRHKKNIAPDQSVHVAVTEFEQVMASIVAPATDSTVQ